MHTVLTGPLFVEMFKEGTATLERNKAAINALNVFPVPDGDTGTNMTLTLKAAQEQLAELETDDVPLSEAAKRAARGVLLGARGNSGVILSQFLRGFAEGVAGLMTAGAAELADALDSATKLAYRAVIKPVEGTMLTVGRGASEAAKAAASAGRDLAGVLQAAVDGAEQALARTPELLAVLKRAGVVDAGGQGLLCFLQGVSAACSGRRTAALPEVAATDVAAPEGETFVDASDMHNGTAPSFGGALAELHRDLDAADITYGYCTEFLIRGDNLRADEIKKDLEPLGDSLLVVGDADLVKVHVHTEHPGQALEIGVRYGDLLGISVDNMREQQRAVARNMITADETPSDVTTPAYDAALGSVGEPVLRDVSGPGVATMAPEWTRVGVVAVAPGEGWERLLLSLGVERIVRGGQTMNPSAAELLAAIEAVEADGVVVLPNNGNVIFAARQAQQLTKRAVHVIETTSPPAGVAAMMAYNPHGDAEDVAVTMDAAARQVRTAEIAYAARDSEAWGDGIRAGDTLGIVDGEIKVIVDDAEQAVLDTLEQLVTPDMSFVSIYYGEEADEAAAERLAERVRLRWPHCEVELFDGGQPVYYYLLSVE